MLVFMLSFLLVMCHRTAYICRGRTCQYVEYQSTRSRDSLRRYLTVGHGTDSGLSQPEQRKRRVKITKREGLE